MIQSSWPITANKLGFHRQNYNHRELAKHHRYSYLIAKGDHIMQIVRVEKGFVRDGLHVVGLCLRDLAGRGSGDISIHMRDIQGTHSSLGILCWN